MHIVCKYTHCVYKHGASTRFSTFAFKSTKKHSTSEAFGTKHYVRREQGALRGTARAAPPPSAPGGAAGDTRGRWALPRAARSSEPGAAPSSGPARARAAAARRLRPLQVPARESGAAPEAPARELPVVVGPRRHLPAPGRGTPEAGEAAQLRTAGQEPGAAVGPRRRLSAAARPVAARRS